MRGELVVLRRGGWQAVFEFALPLLCLGFVGWSFLDPSDGSDLVRVGVAAMGGMSLAWLYHQLARRVRLSPDRLEYFNGLWERGIDRRDVKGTRGIADGSSGTFFLIPKDADRAPIKFPLWIFKHPEAAYWFEGLNDLDALDEAAADAALATEPAFGASPEARRLRLKLLNYAITGLTFAISVVCLLSGYGWTTREAIFGIVALPFAAVALNLAFPKILRLANENGKSDPRPSLGALLYLPALFLPMAAYLNLRLFGGTELLAWAAAPALASVIYLGWRAPALRKLSSGIWLVVFASAFWWAAIAYADVLLDNGPHQVYPVKVLALRIDHDGDDTTHYVTLAPWGRQTEPRNESVYYWIYDQLKVGGKVCVTVGWGLFGVAWYDIGTCPIGGRTSP